VEVIGSNPIAPTKCSRKGTFLPRTDKVGKGQLDFGLRIHKLRGYYHSVLRSIAPVVKIRAYSFLAPGGRE
jgi:hypothetical protein